MQRARKSRSNAIRAGAKPTSRPVASNPIETNQEYLARAVAEVKALLRGPADLSDNGILGADYRRSGSGFVAWDAIVADHPARPT